MPAKSVIGSQLRGGASRAACMQRGRHACRQTHAVVLGQNPESEQVIDLCLAGYDVIPAPAFTTGPFIRGGLPLFKDLRRPPRSAPAAVAPRGLREVTTRLITCPVRSENPAYHDLEQLRVGRPSPRPPLRQRCDVGCERLELLDRQLVGMSRSQRWPNSFASAPIASWIRRGIGRIQHPPRPARSSGR